MLYAMFCAMFYVVLYVVLHAMLHAIVHNTLENTYKDKGAFRFDYFVILLHICIQLVIGRLCTSIQLASEWEIILDQIACQALTFHGLDTCIR